MLIDPPSGLLIVDIFIGVQIKKLISYPNLEKFLRKKLNWATFRKIFNIYILYCLTEFSFV